MKDKPDYYNENVFEIGEGFVVIKKKIFLEKGKTTTRGEYSKLAIDNKCEFPERASCNDGEFFNRCPFMKYDNSQNSFSSTRWRCTCKKNA